MIDSWNLEADSWWGRHCLRYLRAWRIGRFEIRLYPFCPVLSTGYMPVGTYMPRKRAVIFFNLMVLF